MVTINDAESMDDLTDFIAAKVKANFVCIPRSSLPELPSEWQIPFAYGTVNGHTGVGMECVHDANNRCMVFDCGHQTGKFLASLLNAVYGKGE